MAHAKLLTAKAEGATAAAARQRADTERAKAAAAEARAQTEQAAAASALGRAQTADATASAKLGAANAAEADASQAGIVAAAAERAATAADNAQQSATEANQAATRAEEAAKKRLEEQRKARVDAGAPDTGAPMSSTEEALLLKQYGQTCVEEWKEAFELAGKDVLDWVKANGGAVLLDVIGYTDAKACFSEGDIEACLWTAVNAASIAVVVAKPPALSAAIARVSLGIGEFFEALARGKRVLTEFRKLLEKLKKEPDAPSCPTKPKTADKSTVGASAKTAQASGGAPWPLPCGFEFPELDERAIDDIRDYHFSGGSKV